MADLMFPEAARARPGLRQASASMRPHPFAARMANLVLTAQVQLAHAVAVGAADSAERVAECVERAWPDTPLRALVARTYRAQASERRQAARDVLRHARARCGLAYARLLP